MKLYFRINGETQILSEPGGVLGRADEAAIRIADLSVSSRHATFFWDGEQWWIHPLTDKNPVLRDGTRLPGAKVPLGRKGRLQVGKVRAAFWVEGEAPMVEAAPQPDYQRLRLKEVPANLLLRNQPIVELDALQPPKGPADAELPRTIISGQRLASPPPPLPPSAPAVPAATMEPLPSRGRRHELLVQAGALSAALALICIMGFCIGAWLL